MVEAMVEGVVAVSMEMEVRVGRPEAIEGVPRVEGEMMEGSEGWEVGAVLMAAAAQSAVMVVVARAVVSRVAALGAGARIVEAMAAEGLVA